MRGRAHTLFLQSKKGIEAMASLNDLLEEQERCRNRLWDPDMQELYLAVQKEVNRMAELSTLVVDTIELD